MNNPYEVLGIGKFASNKEIKQRYLQLCRTHHPDIAGQHKQRDFAEINVAFEQLTKHKHRIDTYKQSPFHQQSNINTRLYTQRSLVAGLVLVIGVIAYIQYEPQIDPALSHKDRTFNTSTVHSATSYRSWRKN